MYVVSGGVLPSRPEVAGPLDGAVHVGRLGGGAGLAVGAVVARRAVAVGGEAVRLGRLDLGALVPFVPAGHADDVGAGGEGRPPQRVVAGPAGGVDDAELRRTGPAGVEARRHRRCTQQAALAGAGADGSHLGGAVPDGVVGVDPVEAGGGGVVGEAAGQVEGQVAALGEEAHLRVGGHDRRPVGRRPGLVGLVDVDLVDPEAFQVVQVGGGLRHRPALVRLEVDGEVEPGPLHRLDDVGQ